MIRLTVLLLVSAQLFCSAMRTCKTYKENRYHNSCLYGKVMIAESRLLIPPDIQKIHSTTSSKVKCIMSCAQKLSCQLACWEPDQQLNCVMYNGIVVSRSFSETLTGPQKTCFTNGYDIITSKSSITGTPSDTLFPKRKRINLIDGFYYYIKDECYKSATQYRPWLLIDLKEVKRLNQISFLCPPEDDLAQNSCKQIEIRTSLTNSLSDGDFSKFTYYGNFIGPGLMNESITLQNTIDARFISIQMMTSGYMVICLVEAK